VKDRLDAAQKALAEAIKRKAEEAAVEAARQQRVEREAKARAPHPTVAQPLPMASYFSPEVWPAEDVELSTLQRAAIRVMRASGRSLEGLARAFRTRPDQIRRVCREEAP